MSKAMDNPVEAELVESAYQLLLGRPPENVTAVDFWVGQSRRELLSRFLSSEEFAAVNGDVLARFVTHASTPPSRPSIRKAPAIDVEWQVSGERAERLLRMVQATWSELGQTEPHWSVLSGDGFLAANIGENEQKFFDSGAGDVRLIEGVLARHNLHLSSFPTCLEYGVGVGRVAAHLATKVERLIACDISASHLDLARRRLESSGIENVTLVHSSDMSTFGMVEPFDFWFSRIVLQHNPPPIIAMILRRMFKMLAPGGVALFQVPVYARGYGFSVSSYLDNIHSGDGIEMHCLPQAAIFKLAAEQGCEVLEVREDDDTGHPAVYISNTLLFQKKR